MAKPLLISSLSVLIRSLLFNALFYASLTVHMVVALPTFFLPRRVLLVFVRSYARTSLWLLRVVCGIKVEWRGIENIPRGACIIACKHQSAWETFALYAVLRDPAYILKRELMWIPLFGWYTWKAGLIPVNREAGLAALSRMTTRARQELARARQVVIFPEGTRRPPGAEPVYKPGIALSLQQGRCRLRAAGAQFRAVLATPVVAPRSRHHRCRGARADCARTRPQDFCRAVGERSGGRNRALDRGRPARDRNTRCGAKPSGR